MSCGSHSETVLCRRCGELGAPSSIPAGRDRSEAWGAIQSRPVYALACGHCGSTDVEEARVCEACHEAPAAHKDDFCLACALADNAAQAA